MKIREVYLGQPVALAHRPDEMLGTVVEVLRHQTVVVKLRDSNSTACYGVKVLVAYKGG